MSEDETIIFEKDNGAWIPSKRFPALMMGQVEGGPYSRVEQLEKMIELRNKGEITSEEFEEMKKEILGK